MFRTPSLVSQIDRHVTGTDGPGDVGLGLGTDPDRGTGGHVVLVDGRDP